MVIRKLHCYLNRSVHFYFYRSVFLFHKPVLLCCTASAFVLYLLFYDLSHSVWQRNQQLLGSETDVNSCYLFSCILDRFDDCSIN